MMINPSDYMRYSNVISRKYYFHYQEFNEKLQHFVETCVQCEASIKGPLFYSINNIPQNKWVAVEFFLPVEEDYIDVKGDMFFHSYFSIEDMISTCLHHNFREETEKAYSMLLHTTEQNNLQQVTPFFHVISGDETLQYTFIKLGVVGLKEQG